jgi:hypothetical protein
MEERGERRAGIRDEGLGIGGNRQCKHARGVAKGAVQIVGDAPALGGDFDDFAGGIGEIEEDFRGNIGIAFKADTVVDFLDLCVAVLGARFEGTKDGAQGERGGGGFVFGIVIGGEPVAKIGGAQRQDAARIDTRWNAGTGLAVLGEERTSGAGVIEEGERLVGLVKALGHRSRLSVLVVNRARGLEIGEVAEGVGEIGETEWLLGSLPGCSPQRDPLARWHHWGSRGMAK